MLKFSFFYWLYTQLSIFFTVLLGGALSLSFMYWEAIPRLWHLRLGILSFALAVFIIYLLFGYYWRSVFRRCRVKAQDASFAVFCCFLVPLGALALLAFWVIYREPTLDNFFLKPLLPLLNLTFCGLYLPMNLLAVLRLFLAASCLTFVSLNSYFRQERAEHLDYRFLVCAGALACGLHVILSRLLAGMGA